MATTPILRKVVAPLMALAGFAALSACGSSTPTAVAAPTPTTVTVNRTVTSTTTVTPPTVTVTETADPHPVDAAPSIPPEQAVAALGLPAAFPTKSYAGHGSDVVTIDKPTNRAAVVTFSCPGCVGNVTVESDADTTVPVVDTTGPYTGSQLIDIHQGDNTKTVQIIADSD